MGVAKTLPDIREGIEQACNWKEAWDNIEIVAKHCRVLAAKLNKGSTLG